MPWNLQLRKLVSPKLPMASLNDLPNEIVSIIIAHFSVRDRMIIRNLNRRWRQLSLAGIDELLIADPKFGQTNEPFLKYHVDFVNEFVRLKVFEMIVKEHGSYLKILDLDLLPKASINTPDYMKLKNKVIARTFANISIYCPNLVGLSIKCAHISQQEYPYSLFRRYGQQLKIAYFRNHKLSKDLCDFSIEQFNPACLRNMSIYTLNDRNFERVVHHFPLLTRIEIWTVTEYFPSDFNFECLQTLTCLQDFTASIRYSDHNFCSMISSLNAKSLQRLQLAINYSNIFQDSFRLLSRFTCLRSLLLSPWEIKFEYLAAILVAVQNLPHLEYLDIRLWVQLEERQRMKQSLPTMSLLKNVKKLCILPQFRDNIFFDFISIGLMPGVQDLKIGFVDLPYMMEESERNEIHESFKILHKVFPNLIRLTVSLKEKTCVSYLLEGLSKMKKLQHFSYAGNAKHELKLQKFCDKKKIQFEFFRLKFF